MEKDYNGWKNYETWLINLHISNDQGMLSYLGEVATECAEGFNHEHGIIRLLAVGEAVKEAVTDLVLEDVSSGSIAADCVHSVLSEVYWPEIAEALLDSE